MPAQPHFASNRNGHCSRRQAEANRGCGYIELLDQVAHRGNRTSRVPDASRALLQEYLSTHYAAPQAKRAAAVYRLYREEAIRQGIPPIGERTFYYERARFTDQEVTNGILRYPAHERRKTQTLQTERRWVQGETRWEIISGARRKD